MKLLQDLRKWEARHKDALEEIAERIQLSGNIVLSLLSLQSWISFMSRWLRVKIILLEAEGMPGGHDEITIRAADCIFKVVFYNNPFP